MPQDPETYVHRVGRTGRAGQTGMAMTFVVSREMGQLRDIERAIRRKVTRKRIPTLSDVIEGNQRAAIESLEEAAGNGGLEEYHESAEELLNRIDSVSLVSAAIKLLTKHPDVTPVNITEERPQFKKRRGAGGRRRFDGEGHRGEKRRRFESGGKTKKQDRRKKEDYFSGHKTKKHGGDKKGNIHESSFKPYFKEL